MKQKPLKPPAPKRRQTRCPINFALNIFGDKWSLIVLRDLLLEGKHEVRDFLASSEGISTNILTNRLDRLVQKGLLLRKEDPKNRRKLIYKPTQRALDIIPILSETMRWGLKYSPDADLDYGSESSV